MGLLGLITLKSTRQHRLRGRVITTWEIWSGRIYLGVGGEQMDDVGTGETCAMRMFPSDYTRDKAHNPEKHMSHSHSGLYSHFKFETVYI